MPQTPLAKSPAGKKKASGGSAGPVARQHRKGRTAINPKKGTDVAVKKLQKTLAANINRNIEETLAAKASAVKSLHVLQGIADRGTKKLASDPKAGRTGRAVKGVQKKK